MRVLIADDHALFRDGLASLLGAWGHDVVGQAADGEAAVALVEQLRPDLVLMDVRMPRLSGPEATRRIIGAWPEAAIVMVTVSEDEDDLFEAIKAGAHGYLLKSLEGAELRAMIDGVARGEPAMAPATAFRIIRLFGGSAAAVSEPSGDGHLTDRERDVLELVTAGLRNKEIAARLGIAETTVKFHLRNILEKLHAVSRTELATRAMREQLLRRD
jgi:two-component system NarL family response regulator